MTDIFNDVASHWDDLDGKQKSYLATALAGTRQQNTFLALMNDLSKGLEGGSRAWELYQGAMQSAGTVMEKYDVWENSVEAANGRLQASLENIYSVISGKMIVGATDLATRFLQDLAAATQLSGGLNILIPVIGAVGIALMESAKAGTVFETIINAIQMNKFILAIAGVIAAVGFLSTMWGEAS